MKRQPMTYESKEMAIKAFRGLGTVARENNSGENFIVIGRDARALKVFWKRWNPDFSPDVSMFKKSVVISAGKL